jgi:hypothetical protein
MVTSIPLPETRNLASPGTDAETTRPMKAEHKARLLRAVRNGLIWLGELVDLKVADTEALAQREGLSERNIRMTLSLAFLAPDVIIAALDGRLPRGLGLTRLTELPVSWTDHARVSVSSQFVRTTSSRNRNRTSLERNFRTSLFSQSNRSPK